MQGIFSLIEDESKKRTPSGSNLHNMIFKNCRDKKEFKIITAKHKKSIMVESPEYCFVIRHFSRDVCYSTVLM